MMSKIQLGKVGLLMLLIFAAKAQAADISLASDLAADFFNPAIPVTEALILQSNGNANMAIIDQTGSTVGGGNYSEILQTGSLNQAFTVQIGDSNRIRIDQTGGANYANVTQNGSGNSLDLAQTGDANLTASQIGNYNSIVVNQINQNGMPAILSEVGNNNSIILNANTPGLSVNVSIVGDGMTINRTF
jgi:hypothetical protein